MPTQQRNKKGKLAKTWRARVKFEGQEHYLGSYSSKEEAAAVEKAYRDDLEEDFGPPHLRGYNSRYERRERAIRQHAG